MSLPSSPRPSSTRQERVTLLPEHLRRRWRVGSTVLSAVEFAVASASLSVRVASVIPSLPHLSRPAGAAPGASGLARSEGSAAGVSQFLLGEPLCGNIVPSPDRGTVRRV